MSTDFTTATDDWDDDPDVRERLERNASFSIIAAILAHVGALLVCCSSGILGLPSIVLGVLAIIMAKGVLDSGVGGGPRAYALSAVVISTIAIAWSTMVTLLYCAYIGIYVAMIGILMAGGNL